MSSKPAFKVDNKSLAIGAVAGAALALGVAKLCKSSCKKSCKNSKFTLTYFNLYGLAEVSRLLLVDADQKFTDERFSFEYKAAEKKSDIDPKWPEAKNSGRFPLKTLPLLEVDGVSLNQSRAIENYLASRFGFNGSNCAEKAAIESVVEQIKDIRQSWSKLTDETRNEFFITELPKHLATLEEFATKNGKQDHFFVGNSLSLADIAFFNLYASVFQNFQGDVDKLLAGTKRLTAIRDAVAKNPRIAAYIASRAKRPF